jgi:hypothetical protein
MNQTNAQMERGTVVPLNLDAAKQLCSIAARTDVIEVSVERSLFYPYNVVACAKVTWQEDEIFESGKTALAALRGLAQKIQSSWSPSISE